MGVSTEFNTVMILLYSACYKFLDFFIFRNVWCDDRDSDDVQALSVLTEGTEVHGRKVSVGNVVIEMKKIIMPGLLPVCTAAFDMDEPLSVGGFYEWQSNRIALVQIT